MAIDIAVLATTVVTSFLMPYAKDAVEQVAENVTKKVGEKAADYVTDLADKVWGRVKQAFSKPEEQTVLSLFEQNPDEMEAMLIKTLKEKLERDSKLAQTLHDLIETPGPDGQSSGAQIMNAGIAGIADLRGADLSHAQNMSISGVTINKGQTPEPKKPDGN